MSDSSISVYANITERCTGEPRVIFTGDGDLQIYPAGSRGPCLFVSPADWRILNGVVEAAIVKARTDAIAADLRELAAEEPVLGESVALDNLLESEGLR